MHKALKGLDVLTKKIIHNFAQTPYDLAQFVETYKKKSLENVRHCTPLPNEPILLCVAKDSLITVKAQVDWHRRMGIKNFVYVDNMSTDGTFEWLLSQKDVSLFIARESFSEAKKIAWRRIVMDIFGYDRWYLYLDQDEFFCYPGIESIPIQKYIHYLEEKGICTTLAPMIDMYSNNSLYSENQDSNNIMDEYCYFDTDTYTLYKNRIMPMVRGGPRSRLYQLKDYFILSKYPFVRVNSETIMGNQRVYPTSTRFLNSTTLALGFLLHYKFLPHDYLKFKEHITSGVQYNDPRVLRLYTESFEKNNGISFFYEGSQKFNSSMDLLKINICDRVFFEAFLAENGINIVD